MKIDATMPARSQPQLCPRGPPRQLPRALPLPFNAHQRHVRPSCSAPTIVGTRPSEPNRSRSVACSAGDATHRAYAGDQHGGRNLVPPLVAEGNMAGSSHGPTQGGPDMQLAGQVALITGGSRGIGRATALAFAKEGADIAFCHLDDGAKAEETAAEITALGRRALHRSVDVADVAASKAFAALVAQSFGTIDILLNNAGMNIRKPFEAYSEAEFDRLIGVHLKGMFFMAQKRSIRGDDRARQRCTSSTLRRRSAA